MADPATLDRIRRLAIPPAWTDVWISPDPASHLQATGRDARGRKQYRYHPAWRARREDEKFDRLVRFGECLPRIRRRVARDLRLRGLPRAKVLAAVVRLLDLTFIRVGNEEYARLYRSFGLTTLRGRHVTVSGEQVRFRFRGKAGRNHDVSIRDRRLAAIVRRCRDLPGQDLFTFVDEAGVAQDVRSEDVNEYLREAAGRDDVSAKDFRTWSGTVLAYRALQALAPPDGETDASRAVVAAVRETAEHLGNTPAVTRASYVHPAVIEGYLDAGLRTALIRTVAPSGAGRPTRRDEAAVMTLLRRSRRRRLTRPVAGSDAGARGTAGATSSQARRRAAKARGTRRR